MSFLGFVPVAGPHSGPLPHGEIFTNSTPPNFGRQVLFKNTAPTPPPTRHVVLPDLLHDPTKYQEREHLKRKGDDRFINKTKDKRRLSPKYTIPSSMARVHYF